MYRLEPTWSRVSNLFGLRLYEKLGEAGHDLWALNDLTKEFWGTSHLRDAGNPDPAVFQPLPSSTFPSRPVGTIPAYLLARKHESGEVECGCNDGCREDPHDRSLK